MSPAIPLLSRLMISCPLLHMLCMRKGNVMNRNREEHASVCNVMHLETASPIKFKCTSDITTYERGTWRRVYKNWGWRIVIFSCTLEPKLLFYLDRVDLSEYNGSYLNVHILFYFV